MTVRLTCEAFWVDVRLSELNGRWLASADTPDGPSIGLGVGAVEAIAGALSPYHGAIEDLTGEPAGSLERLGSALRRALQVRFGKAARFLPAT